MGVGDGVECCSVNGTRNTWYHTYIPEDRIQDTGTAVCCRRHMPHPSLLLLLLPLLLLLLNRTMIDTAWTPAFMFGCSYVHESGLHHVHESGLHHPSSRGG